MKTLILISVLILSGCIASSSQIKKLHEVDVTLHDRVVIIEGILEIPTGEKPPPPEEPWWYCLLPEIIAMGGAIGIPGLGAIGKLIGKA